MNFPDSYFEDEVRCGFYINSMMKKCWASQIEVLSDIAKVCEKYHLEWFAAWGTLLGTIRHEGFVPWDDDLDICMKRKDYETFLKVAPSCLPKNYSLMNYQNDKDYDQFLTRVVSARTITMDSDYMEKYHGFPYSSGVDIFPLDYISRNNDEDSLQQTMIQSAVGVSRVLKNPESTDEEKEESICLLEQLLNVHIDRKNDPAGQAFMYADKLLQLYHEEDADYITMMPLWATEGTLRFPKECYASAVNMPFEGFYIKVPVGYREVLKRTYWYFWEYARAWGTHDYPYYKHMAAKVADVFGFKDLHFDPSGKEIPKRRELSPKDVKDRTVVFLPYKPEMWDTMDSLYREAKEAGCKVLCVPVPYANRKFDKSLTDFRCETEGYPEDIELTDADSIDLKELHPDIIFIQNPFDAFSDSCMADERFFAEKLREETDQLIYIPGFTMDEVYDGDDRGRQGFIDYGAVAGVFYADRTYVQSKNMKHLYVDEWTKITGENTRSIWENKIFGTGNPAFDVPKKELEKPVIMYRPAAGAPASTGEKILKKIRDTFETFESENDVTMLWRPDPSMGLFFENERKDLKKEYQSLIEEYKAKGKAIFDDTSDLKEAINMSDALLGDPSALVPVFKRKGLPIMIDDPEMVYHDSALYSKDRILPGRGDVIGDKYYFITGGFNGLFALDTNTGVTEYVTDLPDRNSYGKPAYTDVKASGEMLYIIPYWGRNLVSYNTVTGEKRNYTFWDEKEVGLFTSSGNVVGHYAFMFQNRGNNIFRIDLDTGKVDRDVSWAEELGQPSTIYASCDDGEYLYAGLASEDFYIKIHIEDFKIELYYLSNMGTRFHGCCICGDLLWLSPLAHGALLSVNRETGEMINRVDLLEVSKRGEGFTIRDMMMIGEELLLFPMEWPGFLAYNVNTGALRGETMNLTEEDFGDFRPGMGESYHANAILRGEKIYFLILQTSTLAVFDLCELTMKRIPFSTPVEIKERQSEALISYALPEGSEMPIYVEQPFFGVPDYVKLIGELERKESQPDGTESIGKQIMDEVLR